MTLCNVQRLIVEGQEFFSERRRLASDCGIAVCLLASATIAAMKRSRSRRCRNSRNASRTSSDRDLCSILASSAKRCSNPSVNRKLIEFIT